ncbi:MAG: protein serine/threonine phosphatase 2C family protein [Bacilli bacterium]|nr:protein serine/threonine phosphatase 2C family protein [Bacilli bacterium]
MHEDFGIVLEKGIVSTSKKYPERNMSEQIEKAVKKYCSIIREDSEKSKYASDYFCKCFTRKDEKTNENIRDNIKNSSDAVLSMFDYLYRYSLNELSNSRVEPKNENYINSLLIYVNSYVDTIKRYDSIDLISVRNKVYNYPYNLDLLTNSLNSLMPFYIETALKKHDRTINVTEFTDTGKQLFSNLENKGFFDLRDEYHGVYKTGNLNVQIASTLGYKTKKRPQQDAVLSVSKDNCSMHVVADGAGGSNMGQVASSLIVRGLKEWFDSSNFSIFNNIKPNDTESIRKATSIISDSFDRVIKAIDKKIKENYDGSYSTVVVSIATPGFILFANVGDSTAFVYDDDKKTITQKTVLDSMSRGMGYEAARHNPLNNQITNGIGMMNSEVHYNVMPNEGKFRIVMSSDGITDLISAQNFEYLTTNGYTADDYVRKADQMPDISKGMKSQDNISAIVIDSDEYAKKRRTR